MIKPTREQILAVRGKPDKGRSTGNRDTAPSPDTVMPKRAAYACTNGENRLMIQHPKDNQ